MNRQQTLLTKIENNKKLAGFVFVLYVLLLCIVSYYHEPWHDEGQAWLIARDDSIWHLITVTTHYEGHPPLWHFILMPFAQMGVPFELGIKSINIVFCSIAMWLLIYKSPLPFYLRYLLPFTYFLFYQYGVINRTYSLLMLAMMLVAYYYPSKERQPYKLALALAALCGSMAYGAILALGIALSWVSEIFVKQYRDEHKRIKALVYEPEAKALVLLLLISVFWAYCILPRPDTEYISGGIKVHLIDNFLFSFFLIPGQALCTNDIKDGLQVVAAEFFFNNVKIYWNMIKDSGIYAILILVNYLLSYFYGVLIQLSFCYITYVTGKLQLYLLPISLYALLASCVYWTPHHAGIVIVFFVFILWQVFADKAAVMKLEEHLSKQFIKKNQYILFKFVVILSVVGCMFIGINWSFTSSRVDIKNSYDISRDVAYFIKANKLEPYAFWIKWRYAGDNEENVVCGSYAINAYFNKAIIKNENSDREKIAYHQYKVIAKEHFLKELSLLPKPAFLIGKAQIEDVYGHNEKYVKIHCFNNVRSWKNVTNIKGKTWLYIREDLLARFPQFHVVQNAEQ